MEEILRMHKEYVLNLPQKVIGQCLTVILSVLLLSTIAAHGNEHYTAINMAEYGDNYIYTKVIPANILDTAFLFTKIDAPVFPFDDIGLSKRTPRYEKVDKTNETDKHNIPAASRIQKPSATTVPHTTTDKPAIQNTTVHDVNTVSVEDTSSAISTSAKDMTAVKVPLDTILTDNNDTPPEISTPSITISAYGNGGLPETAEITINADTFSMDMLETPTRLGKLFDGWYLDAECTIPFTETDIASNAEKGISCLPLYAGWTEFPGFLSNDLGYITSYTAEPDTVIDGFLTIPYYESCTGIAGGAFDNIADYVFEIYIPEYITYIEEGAFDNLYLLMYIEVSAENPVYYSKNGILYHNDGTEAAYPAGRKLGTGFF